MFTENPRVGSSAEERSDDSRRRCPQGECSESILPLATIQTMFEPIEAVIACIPYAVIALLGVTVLASVRTRAASVEHYVKAALCVRFSNVNPKTLICLRTPNFLFD